MQILNPDPTWSTKVLVSIDVANYTSHVATALSASAKPEDELYKLNKAIADSVRTATKSVQGSVCENIFKLTGDGALLVFDDSIKASDFALAARTNASSLPVPGAPISFRVGIEKGNALIFRDANECAADVFGMCVIDAVRFEGDCTVGEVFVSDDVYNDLPAASRHLTYPYKKSFRDKNRVKHSGFETTSAPPASFAASSSSTSTFSSSVKKVVEIAAGQLELFSNTSRQAGGKSIARRPGLSGNLSAQLEELVKACEIAAFSD